MAKERIDFADENVRDKYRHTTSHIMAQAIKNIWPEAKLAIGPAIENGFYYDIDLEHKFTDEDLKAIEKEMKKIIKAGYPLERFELPRDEAIKFMEDRNEDYKVELIKDLPEGEVISFYKQTLFCLLSVWPERAGYTPAAQPAAKFLIKTAARNVPESKIRIISQFASADNLLGNFTGSVFF